MTPAEHAAFNARAARMQYLRRRQGVPNGVSLQGAITLHMITTGEVEQARRGEAGAQPAHPDPSRPSPS